MNIKSKMLLFIAIFTLLFGLCSCGGTDGDGNKVPGIQEGEKIEVFLHDQYVEYNGQMYQIELDIRGKLPAGVSVRYEYIRNGEFISDKGVVEPGEYEVRVFFEGDYERYGLPSELTAHLTIKGDYKPGEVWFEPQTFMYDGNMHSIYINGYIPSDVKVRYEYYLDGEGFVSDHGAIEPGNYQVFAYFEGPFEEYGLPHMLEAWMHIESDEPIQKVDIKFDDLVYCPEEIGYKTLEIQGQLPADVWVEYENNCPEGYGIHHAKAYFHGEIEKYGLPHIMEATITIYQRIVFEDKVVMYNGMTYSMSIDCYIPEDITVNYSEQYFSEPGEYYVTAYLSGDLGKYGFDDKYHAKLTIFDPAMVTFDAKVFEYDGRSHSVVVENLPTGVFVEYEYYLNGEFISEKSVKEPGVYNVIAYLMGDYYQYGLPDMLETILEINPDPSNFIEINFIDQTFTYSGQEYAIYIEGDLPSDVGVNYYDNCGIDAGTYYACAQFYGEYRKYGLDEYMYATLQIDRLTIYDSDIIFEDQTSPYDGGNKYLYATSNYSQYLNLTYNNNEGHSMPGSYPITVNVDVDYNNIEYLGFTSKTAYLTIGKMIYTVNESLIRFNNSVVEYNGENQYVTIDNSSLPEEVYVDYEIDNFYSEVGTYTATFALRLHDSYREMYQFEDGDIYFIHTQMTITKKKIEVQFEQTEFTYDGTVKKLVAKTDDLPINMEINIEGNGRIDAGTYDIYVYVQALEDSSNYTYESFFIQKMVINKAEFPGDYRIRGLNVNYTGSQYAPYVENLPFNSTYTINEEYAVEVGEYSFTITLKNPNYNDKTISCTLIVNPAEFDYTSIKFTQTRFEYNGETHYLELANPEIIPDYYSCQFSMNQFTEVGSYWVRIDMISYHSNYATFYYEIEVVVTQGVIDLSNVEFNDMNVTYNGNEYVYELDIELPNGISRIEYLNNRHTDAGSYDVTIKFVLENDSYKPVENKVVKLNIAQAEFDMSNILFEDIEYTYDGESKSIIISGDLDPNISISYRNNEQINVGNYLVTAVFTHSLGNNYKEIQPMTATLTIVPQVLEVEFSDTTVTYDGQSHSILINEEELVKGASVRYEGNNNIDAGEYKVVAYITTPDGSNYIYPEKLEATLYIEKADLDISYEDRIYSYNGSEYTHNITLNGLNRLPDGITVEYENNTAIRAGQYTATATFYGENKNYNTPMALTSTFELVKQDYFDITLIIEDKVEYIYAVRRGTYIPRLLPEIPEKPHYNAHWDTNSNYIDADITITAVYELIAYRIYIDTDGAILNNPVIFVNYNEEYTLPDVTRDGYTFDGYYYDDMLFTDGVFTYSTNIVIKAKWNPNKYNLTYKDILGNIIKTDEVSFGDLITLPEIIELDDKNVYTYNFNLNDQEYQSNDIFEYLYAEDITLICKTLDIELNNYFTFTWDEFEKTLLITSYSGQVTSLTIPEVGYYLDDYYPITALGAESIGNEYLTELIINSNVTTYANGCLANCTNLEELTIPYLKQYISTLFFTSNYPSSSYNAKITSTLKKVVILDRYKKGSNYQNINSGAFSSCEYIEEVVLPEGLTQLSMSMFYGCKSLEKINIPSTVTSFNSQAFYGCTSLKSIDLNDNIVSLGTESFKDCTSLESIVLPEKLQFLSAYVFENCTNLSSVTLPEILETIGNYTFRNCDSLAKINIPDSVQSIGSNAFEGCDNLVNVNIKSTSQLTKIDYAAFRNCVSLSSFYVPNGVEKISQAVFEGCTLLTDVRLHSNITYISLQAFKNCTNLSSINLFNKLTYIGDDAFYKTPLTSISLPDTLEYIGTYAFAYTNLTTITIPSKVTEITNGLLYNCANLTTVYLPQNLVTIGESAFSKCSLLANINLPSSVEEIKLGAFKETALTSITIPSKVTTIANNTFDRCTNLSTVTILGRLTTIEKEAFHSCSSLETINLVDSIDYIGDYAFYNCTSLTSVHTPANLTVVNRYAFSDVPLTSFDFSNIEYIGDYAFYRSKLESVNFFNVLTYIGQYAFYESTIEEIIVPNSVQHIGDRAFSSVFAEYVEIPFIGSTITNSEKYSIGRFFSVSEAKTLVINGGIIYSDSIANLPMVEHIIISNDVIYAESFYNVNYSKNLEYNTYGNGYYLGNETNKYLLFMSAIDPEAPVTYHSSCKFNNINFAQKLTLENNIYYLSAYGNDYYMAIMVEDTNATEIIFNDNTYYIASNMLHDCSKLVKVVFPNSLKHLPEDVLMSRNLKEVTVPYLASNPELDILYTFRDILHPNTNATLVLDSLTINGGIIKENALDGHAVKKLIIGKNVTEICDNAFNVLNRSNYSYVLELVIAEDSKLTRIGDYAFYCNKLESINLPDSLVSIGDAAFMACNYLTSITIPANVETIGMKAFQSTDALQEVIFAEGSKVTVISEFAFSQPSCKMILKSVVLPENLVRIENNAFEYCRGLTEIVLPSTVNYIGAFAFNDCDHLERINLGDTQISAINEHAFEYCYTMKEFIIPATVKYIGDYAFSNCGSVTKYTFADNSQLEEIGDYAFSNNSSLVSLILPDGLKTIGDNMLTSSNIKYETELYIPESVIQIGVSNFGSTIFKQNIEVPKGLESIDISNYSGSCSKLVFGENIKEITNINNILDRGGNLTAVYIHGGIKGFENIFAILQSNAIIYFQGTVEEWLEAETVQNHYNKVVLLDENGNEYHPTEIKVPDHITRIDGNKFREMTSLVSIDLNNVSEIGRYAFYNCTNLVEIIWPEQMELIEYCAFYNCPGSEKIEVNAKYIEDQALKMTKVNEVIIGPYTREIGSSALPQYTKKVVISEGVTKLGRDTLGYPSDELYLPNSLVVIETFGAYPTYLYYNGTILDLLSLDSESFNITNSSYTYIKDDNDEYYEIHDSVVIPEGVTEIPRHVSINTNNIYLPSTLEKYYGYIYTSKAYYAGTFEQYGELILNGVISYTNLYVLDDEGIEYQVGGDVYVPLSWTEIPSYAIKNAKNIYIHKGIEKINFRGISEHAENIYYDGTIEDWCNIEIVESNNSYYGYHFFLKNEDGIYEEVKVVSIPESVTEIGYYQFGLFTHIEKVFMHDRVTKVGFGAFKRCNFTDYRDLDLSSSLIEFSADMNNIDKVIIDTNMKRLSSIYLNIFYLGTPEEKEANLTHDWYESHKYSFYYYSEEQPTDSTYKYWHYDADGIAVAW